MKLSDLIKAVSPSLAKGVSDQEIQGLYYDSRIVQPGGLFFALKGTVADGHRFIGLAIERGAAAVVVEDRSSVPTGFPFIQVENSRLAMALMASAFYRFPTRDVPLVGITGTNGKTTTSYLIEGIMAANGVKAAVLGTVSYRLGEMVLPASHTTPESTELQSIMRTMIDGGATGVVMEVSSHSLDQRRVDGCQFDVGVFTNLTRDHLDFHGSMESYLSAKLRLFKELLQPTSVKPTRRAVVNLDDEYGAAVARESVCPVITYSISTTGDVHAVEIKSSLEGISGKLVTPAGTIAFSSGLVGQFNLYNILSAVATGYALGFPLATISAGIANHKKVPGRLERVENDLGIGVFVDYAHTGDALENVLQTLSELKTNRILTVFGCGGDRDKGKRPIMGEIAGRLSDLAVITSDNPRTEKPEEIIAQVRAGAAALGIREYDRATLGEGLRDKGFIVVPDRRDAIGLTISLAEPGDIVLLAGKGHEDYQIIGTTKHHFDDREEAAAALSLRGGAQ
ncbi:UDP-N-acetylmuramoyl-L-alanyl-D-glutamate--2,6-diaminopimelate ligase [Geobacter pelophilus]|uniref:UDP-N-acetylmuramoyl-L-alanyl-D-glutamate--2,6-diaminopimelate ligase n=1 Tax=Geoanaerobacter pelophilus TaxID=60036 RepID=A0AAW4L5G6_9BACT|nr:UDP-N-acetylmuramoyl-L-alanyl-D-glutamate--2,6-diaminopimelate ligase [Geoanaerobacter pelophilus]MBT0663805.1 UDP-N-acetylmuramoyl-L-alanyl-D-glutamate--2,6-diaminopimelate ligase [Geoanaerobacter pelophilus]